MNPSLAQGKDSQNAADNPMNSLGLPNNPTIGQMERALDRMYPSYGPRGPRNGIYVRGIHSQIPTDPATKIAAMSPFLLYGVAGTAELIAVNPEFGGYVVLKTFELGISFIRDEPQLPPTPIEEPIRHEDQWVPQTTEEGP